MRFAHFVLERATEDAMNLPRVDTAQWLSRFDSNRWHVWMMRTKVGMNTAFRTHTATEENHESNQVEVAEEEIFDAAETNTRRSTRFDV